MVLEKNCKNMGLSHKYTYLDTVALARVLLPTLSKYKLNIVAKALGISRANAYNLMRSKGFPTLKIGKRMVVPKDKLIAWIDCQVPA